MIDVLANLFALVLMLAAGSVGAFFAVRDLDTKKPTVGVGFRCYSAASNAWVRWRVSKGVSRVP